MKTKIIEIRKEIDEIDGSLIDLLAKRADLAIAIGKIKRKNNLPILNKAREKEILVKLAKAKNKQFLLSIFKKILEESRDIQNNNPNNNVKIATLGPEGTCSENTAKKFALERALKSKIILKKSFEDCIKSVINKEADIVIVPSAFKELNELIFRNLGEIKLTDAFVLNTPEIVIAKKNAEKIKTIATHSAPAVLIENVFPDAKRIITQSNSISAKMVAKGKADACITTEIAARNNKLEIIKNFGEVPMSWNVFARS